MLSALQVMTGDPGEKDPEKMQEANDRVDCAIKVCETQARSGRHFLFAHLLTATSVRLESMMRLRKAAGTLETIGDMCAFGLRGLTGTQQAHT